MCNEEMTTKELAFEPIRIKEIELGQLKYRWLESYGWKFSCDFIDSCWRWSKEIDGKLMICNSTREAIRIENDFLPEIAPAASEGS